MKKILVEVNETYLEKVRENLERRWGGSVSNSQIVSHLLFLHHNIDYYDAINEARKLMLKPNPNPESKVVFKSTSRKTLRALDQAYKEEKNG